MRVLDSTPERHVAYMKRALALAARGRTSPNPQVGAVIVVGDAIVGEGWHRRCGAPHAEVEALRAAGPRAVGADLYVTLEPCNHHGRTPPCSDAVVTAGIRRVFIGFDDPDSDVAGGGGRRLVEAGIEVRRDIERERCERFYEAYLVHRRQRRPHVLIKAGMTLDGRVATRTGHSQWITGPPARRAVHRLRHRIDAIMVGKGTVIADDPQLTTRLPRGRGHDPIRVIVDTSAITPRDAKVIVHESESPTIIAHGSKGREAASRLQRPGVEVLECATKRGRVDLRDLLHRLAERGIVTLLAEGGGELHWSLLSAGLADRAMLFVAPLIVGGRKSIPVVGGRGVATMNEAFALEDLETRRLGDDLVLEGRIGPKDAKGAS